MTAQPTLSHAAEEVRRLDRDRFVTALFAPADRREDLMVLYAFNQEVARIRDNVRETMAGMIRLQWWRDVLAGGRDEEARLSPVAGPLLAVMRGRNLDAVEFEALLDARERDLEPEPMTDLAELEAYAADTSGRLAQLAVTVLGGHDGDRRAAMAVGQAFALTGLLRSMAANLSTGRLTIPLEQLRDAGITAEEVLAGKAERRSIAAAVRPMAERAGQLLTEARRHKASRAALPAMLPATLASGHLRRLAGADYDVFDGGVVMPNPMPIRLTVNALLGRF